MDLSWDDFEEDISALARKIDYKPNVIVGIARGGMVPAARLSHLLGVPVVYCLTVKKDGDGRRIVTEITGNIKDEDVLLLEDMVETAESMGVVREYLESLGAHVRTACLYTTARSRITPDFYLRQVDGPVHFPWEKT